MRCKLCNTEEFEVLFDSGKAQDLEILKCGNCSLMCVDNIKAISDIYILKSLSEAVPINRQTFEKQDWLCTTFSRKKNDSTSFPK